MSEFLFAPGFQAAGGTCGLKQSGKPDLGLIVADQPCSAAGVFTTNLVKAAPVRHDQRVLAEYGDHIKAIVANSGCANACTGEQGEQANLSMAQATAAALDCQAHQVLVLSTGVIGKQLDMVKIQNGIQQLTPQLAPTGAAMVAKAIMTTDTRPKTASTTIMINGIPVTIAGITKGSGMIHPMMATMLAVITTDIQATSAQLHTALQAANAASFNCVTVDGDPSTNDTALLLTSGAAKVVLDHSNTTEFTKALTDVCISLGRQIAADGEGATKLVEVQVTGAANQNDARTIARVIARSPLVKTAVHGGDPNWGRILAAAGMAGVSFDPAQSALYLGDIQVTQGTTPTRFDEATAAATMTGPEVIIRLDLGQGFAHGTAWTCDLSADYVRINADYRT